MERVSIAPRADWREKVEALGFDWHSAPSPENPAGVYWDESVYWQLTAAEVDLLEETTNELHAMCIVATESAISRGLLPHFGFDPATIAVIEDSWRRRDQDQASLYGRFDLAFTGGDTPPKLLEYNADTPTSLYEASVVQWTWLEELFPDRDQFNSLHEGLVAAWAKVGAQIDNGPVHFTCVMPHAEDEGTLRYMLDTALEAGLTGKPIPANEIGWAVPAGASDDSLDGYFVDAENTPITALFKILPWDWILADRYGAQLAHVVQRRGLTVIEPAWKMVMANKAILAVLWELYPDHPNLLPAFPDRRAFPPGTHVVAKPLLGREGANISIAVLGEDGALAGEPLESKPGAYGEEGYIYQAQTPLASANGFNAVIGSWVIDGVSRGIGIREDRDLITGNRSRFVPHVMI